MATATATPKAAKKTTPAKAKTSKNGTGNGHFQDGAEQVAKASEGKLITSQVRILRALKKSSKPMTRLQLKEAVGLGHKKGFHIKWLKALRELAPKYIKIKLEEGGDGEQAKNYHSITDAGKNLIKEAEANAAKAARANGKS